MQLLAVHQVLIAAAVALASLFGVRAIVLFAKGGGIANLVMAAVSLALAGAFLAYFRKLRARSRDQARTPPRP